MCAICGFYQLGNTPHAPEALDRMLEVSRHRGPDETGVYEKDAIGLGHARLSIVGIQNGRQPIPNEDESLWLVYAGEIFNHVDLRKDLESKGHRFRTDTDAEVVIHLYEEEGMGCLEKLNGQFAFAIWDSNKRELILCRDRVGILPLYYGWKGNTFVFGSEIKTVLAYPGMDAQVEPRALDQIFTFWSVLPPTSPIKDIFQVRPAHYLVVKSREVKETRYWDMDFTKRSTFEAFSEHECAEKITALLTDAVDVRLRADVPVGVYLSGGTDSAAISALAARLEERQVESFSVRFEQSAFDESSFQNHMSESLGTHNSHVLFSGRHLAESLRKSIYHAETPLLRMGLAPFLLLSELVRSKKYKTVIAGEGADEIFLGYNIFKEAKVRSFWSKFPDSRLRPRLLNRLYPYLQIDASVRDSYLGTFFAQHLTQTQDFGYSHRIRWESTSRLKRFFSQELRESIGDYRSENDLERQLHPNFKQWDAVEKAQYLETTLFLSNYLLSSQGDRMAMANSVEVRYPYLDHRLIEFCNQIPSRLKMRGLKEKGLLKKSVRKFVPRAILDRPKQPYRAPGIDLSDPKQDTDMFDDLVTDKSLKESGFFDSKLTGLLVQKARRTTLQTESDQMALNGILTTQLFHRLFVKERSVKSHAVS